jgi:hypothetical protein
MIAKINKRINTTIATLRMLGYKLCWKSGSQPNITRWKHPNDNSNYIEVSPNQLNMHVFNQVITAYGTFMTPTDLLNYI